MKDNAQIIAIDTETGLIRPGRKAPELACSTTSLARQTNQGVELLQPSIHDPAKTREIFETSLANVHHGRVAIVGANFVYDCAVFVEASSDRRRALRLVFDALRSGMVYDLQLRQKLLDIADGQYALWDKPGQPGRGYNLGVIAKRANVAELDKENPWRLRFGELLEVPLGQWPREPVDYALADAGATIATYYAQHAKAQSEGNPAALPHFGILAPVQGEKYLIQFAWMQHLIACWGFRTDEAGVQALEAELLEELDTLDFGEKDAHGRRLWDDPNYRAWDAQNKKPHESAIPLVAAGLIRGPEHKSKAGSRDLKAAAARIQWAYDRIGQPVPTTEKEGISLDRDACEKSLDGAMRRYSRRAQIGTLLSKDVKMLREGIHMPIHTSWGLAETIRTTTFQPNIQNFGRKGGVRECVVPRPGFHFVAADFSGVELRSFAQILLAMVGQSKLADALNAGMDPHLQMAADIRGIDYARAEHFKDTPEIDDARQTGKVANFGFPGGLGPETFVHYAWKSYGVPIELDFARELKQTWRTTWPEVNEYFRIVSDLCEAGQPIEHYKSGIFRACGSRDYTNTCNSFFQNLATMAAQTAGFDLAEACYLGTIGGVETQASYDMHGCRLINFPHDEYIAEVPIGREHEAAHAMRSIMVAAAIPWMPDLAPAIKVEFAAMKRWSKKAKPVFVNGRLVPWEPKAAA